jgi:phosphoribosylformylglycinamidine synthase
MNWQAEVHVLLKPSVNDPPGQSIRGALHSLGFDQVESVRAGKIFLLRLEADDRAAAEQAVDDMCARLLANPVIERYTFTLTEVDATAPATAPPAA